MNTTPTTPRHPSNGYQVAEERTDQVKTDSVSRSHNSLNIQTEASKQKELASKKISKTHEAVNLDDPYLVFGIHGLFPWSGSSPLNYTTRNSSPSRCCAWSKDEGLIALGTNPITGISSNNTSTDVERYDCCHLNAQKSVDMAQDDTKGPRASINASDSFKDAIECASTQTLVNAAPLFVDKSNITEITTRIPKRRRSLPLRKKMSAQTEEKMTASVKDSLFVDYMTSNTDMCSAMGAGSETNDDNCTVNLTNSNLKRRYSLRLQHIPKRFPTHTTESGTQSKSAKNVRKKRVAKRRKSACSDFLRDSIILPIRQSLEVKIEHDTSKILTQNGEKEVVQVTDKMTVDDLATSTDKPDDTTTKLAQTNEATFLLHKDIALGEPDTSTNNKENSTNNTISKIKRENKRRDTFDLFKNRGFIVGLYVPDSTKSPETLQEWKRSPMHIVGSLSSKSSAGSTFESDPIEPRFDKVDVFVKTGIQKALFSLPPKAAEDMNTVVFDDEQSLVKNLSIKSQENFNESFPITEAISSLQKLTLVGIEENMRNYFSDFSVHYYPCVSPRIFSAMSLMYSYVDDFVPLLPLLVSLVNAEMISLKSREKSNDVYFINRKVCFSGYDYSSTMPAVDRISGSHVDLDLSINALESILRQAQELPAPLHHLSLAVECLNRMSTSKEVSHLCSKTIVGYFPSSRFEKAIRHYSKELDDIKSFITSQQNELMQNIGDFSEHIGVRHRLEDFISRSIRFQFRKLLNSIPESLVVFCSDGCDERWSRAVEDRSISSLFNFSLEKVYEFLITNSKLFDSTEEPPRFFSSAASVTTLSDNSGTLRPCKGLLMLEDVKLAEVITDIEEARCFLLGARACKFICELLHWPGVEDHINAVGGWGSVESVAQIFFNMQLDQFSQNKHFVLLQNLLEFTKKLGKFLEQYEDAINDCELCIKKLRRQLMLRQGNYSQRKKGSAMSALTKCINAEKAENFPMLMVNC